MKAPSAGLTEAAALVPEMPRPSAENAPPEDLGLDTAELRILRCLLYGGSLAWVREEGLFSDVLCDSINEKLFDRFDDTVLTLGESPEVIEDYIEELKEMVPQ